MRVTAVTVIARDTAKKREAERKSQMKKILMVVVAAVVIMRGRTVAEGDAGETQREEVEELDDKSLSGRREAVSWTLQCVQDLHSNLLP